MEYEMIRKLQVGILSPTKLRMKLLGPRNGTRKAESNSTKMPSPKKSDDIRCARNSLLSSDVDEEELSNDFKGASEPDNVANYESLGGDVPEKKALNFNNVNQSQLNEKIDVNCGPSVAHQIQSNLNLSITHPVRNMDEARRNLNSSGHDTGGSSFEFYRAERTTKQPSLGLLYRHVPSKWNDAEKWIPNRQMMNSGIKKKFFSQNNHQTKNTTILEKVATDSMMEEHKSSNTEFNQTFSQDMVEKFSFVPHGSTGLVESVNSGSLPRTGDEINCQRLSVSGRLVSGPTAAESVSMRDIGTEMTPVPTPLGSVTPTRSSISSLPLTPRSGAAAPFPNEDMNMEQNCETKSSKDTLNDREMRRKIRREIAALGLQLGKKNIASWASKEEEQCFPSPKTVDTEPSKKDYEHCAAAWEDAENDKHMARYKRERVKIQAWESHQKAKIEAKMKNIEAKAEQMLLSVTEKMTEKLAMTLQRVKEKQSVAQARMDEQAARISRKAERMRQTGQIPSRSYLCCTCLDKFLVDSIEY